tara:strand:- start:14977 stop:15501 length:525 start_codon:yes stop_codon:yes gene_type:complete
MQEVTLRIMMLREAAAVERAHTLPHHGSYSNGAHQYGCVMLYLELCPDPQFNTVRAILAHDLGERWCGDIPAPAKWSVRKDLRAELEELEERCIRRMGQEFKLCTLEAMWLKAVDCLDLWLWSHEQLAMGNRNAQAIVDNIEKFFRLKSDVIPKNVVQFMTDYEWQRTPDEIPE